MYQLSKTFSGRTVLVTGHTGFKGAWLSLWLTELGAKVIGYALTPPTMPNLFDQLKLHTLMDSRMGDIRDADLLHKTIQETKPSIVFHLAAQPLVRRSYEQPLETFSTNVLGTSHVLDAVRRSSTVQVCEIITTDKVYENRETNYAYHESDRLGGYDPYSASKACAELVVSSYRNSFFKTGASISSARAGNVIGGGDWAQDRLIPDCIRALAENKPITVRNPQSIRPWQFVMEPLSGYLTLAAQQLNSPLEFSEAWNFGPMSSNALTTSHVADMVVKQWGDGSWLALESNGTAPHEAGTLQLDSRKAQEKLHWRPVYSAEETIHQTVSWYKESQQDHFNALAFTRQQIQHYTAAAQKLNIPWSTNLSQGPVSSPT